MSEEAEISDEAVEFTLEDAYANLKDVREDLRQELDDWIHRDANNELRTLALGDRQEEIIIRYQKLLAELSTNLLSQEPMDLPLPNTIDLQKCLIRDFADATNQMQQVMNSIKADMAITKKNIAYLQINMEGLEKMKSACLEAIENVGSKTTYDKEISVTSRLFKECRADLYSLVETIFPGNYPFKDLLAILVQAYGKGGDDVYIDVAPETLTFAKFLIEADIAVYHRNDKRKIKMMDVL